MNFKITDIKITKTSEFKRRKKILGYASIIIDNDFCINDIKICTGEYGEFIAMPSILTSGGYKELVTFRKDIKLELQKLLIEKFSEEITKELLERNNFNNE